jgi:hypothetical protein
VSVLVGNQISVCLTSVLQRRNSFVPNPKLFPTNTFKSVLIGNLFEQISIQSRYSFEALFHQKSIWRTSDEILKSSNKLPMDFGIAHFLGYDKVCNFQKWFFRNRWLIRWNRQNFHQIIQMDIWWTFDENSDDLIQKSSVFQMKHLKVSSEEFRLKFYSTSHWIKPFEEYIEWNFRRNSSDEIFRCFIERRLMTLHRIFWINHLNFRQMLIKCPSEGSSMNYLMKLLTISSDESSEDLGRIVFWS